jgi:hypothetical protein
MLNYAIYYDGFHIELWSFSKSLSPDFIKLQQANQTKMTINLLDDYIDILKIKK